MKPHLPQQAPVADRQRRQDWLSRNQQMYRFNFEHLPPLALIDQTPPEEKFSTEYKLRRKVATLELKPNKLVSKVRAVFDPLDEIGEYAELINLLPKPEVIKIFQSDSVFAEQRLSGSNPMMLRQLRSLETLPSVTLDALQAAVGSTCQIELALAQGTLYVADYSPLAFVKGGAWSSAKKYLPTPIAFFVWRKTGYGDRGELMPIAIQLNPKPGSPLFTPADAHRDWAIAKLCVQIADANHHEMASHLCRTHLVMEPFAIATARQLAENHPLGLLLRPHLKFLLYNNQLGRERLINPGGIVDRLLAGTLEESLEILKADYQAWSLDQYAFPNEIKNRGMADVETLPHYPYRDDGVLLWDAIHRYVSGYLRLYYKSAAEIQADYELQNWAAELASQQGGRVKGMPEHIDTVEQLIEIVTTVIFTCGPQHAAVNFSQYDYMAFIPNMPLAAYQPVPQHKGEVDEQWLMQFLPPPRQAEDQLSVTFTLSAYRHDRLGYYDKPFADPEAQALLSQFQQELNHIETKIEARNHTRYIDYNFLKPSLIPNSTSI